MVKTFIIILIAIIGTVSSLTSAWHLITSRNFTIGSPDVANLFVALPFAVLAITVLSPPYSKSSVRHPKTKAAVMLVLLCMGLFGMYNGYINRLRICESQGGSYHFGGTNQQSDCFLPGGK